MRPSTSYYLLFYNFDRFDLNFRATEHSTLYPIHHDIKKHALGFDFLEFSWEYTELSLGSEAKKHNSEYSLSRFSSFQYGYYCTIRGFKRYVMTSIPVKLIDINSI